jgi:hypothetical protein
VPASPARSKALMGLLENEAPALPPFFSNTAGTTPGTIPTSAPADPRLSDCADLFRVLDELSDVEGMLSATRSPTLHRYAVPPLAIALITQSNDAIRILLAHGADPNRAALDAYPLLYLAGVDCNITAARSLLDRGADPAPIAHAYEPVPPATQPAAKGPTNSTGTGTTIRPRPSVCPAVNALAP